MRRVYEIRHVSLGSTLQAQLAVRGHGVVHKDNVIRQLAIIQHFSMVFTQLSSLGFKSELVLEKGAFLLEIASGLGNEGSRL